MGHCWRNRDELISVLLWTPSHDGAKAARPAWTYVQQLCFGTGCIPEDLPETMDDREVWREKVRNIRADSATWWWWWWWWRVFHSSFNWWYFNEVCVTAASLQVFGILQSILAYLNNNVVRMVLILLLISNSSFWSTWEPFKYYSLQMVSPTVFSAI